MYAAEFPCFEVTYVFKHPVFRTKVALLWGVLACGGYRLCDWLTDWLTDWLVFCSVRGGGSLCLALSCLCCSLVNLCVFVCLCVSLFVCLYCFKLYFLGLVLWNVQVWLFLEVFTVPPFISIPIYLIVIVVLIVQNDWVQRKVFSGNITTEGVTPPPTTTTTVKLALINGPMLELCL